MDLRAHYKRGPRELDNESLSRNAEGVRGSGMTDRNPAQPFGLAANGLGSDD
jgi:hypothetical protein